MWYLLEGEEKEKEKTVSLVARRGRVLSVLEPAPRTGLRSGSVAVVTARLTMVRQALRRTSMEIGTLNC
ncbi:unnamed protein product [Coccothraustes coccothraustes]